MSLCHRTYLFPTRVVSSFTRKSKNSAKRTISSTFNASSSLPATSSYSLSSSSPSTTTIICKQTSLPHMRTRRYTTSAHTHARTVDLAFSAIAPASSAHDSNGLRDTVVLHGLFGSGNNWRNMAKRLSESSQSNIYLMDERNHGNSPHSEEVNYEVMAEDVIAFIEKHSLKDVSIIGHSMGGKVGMVVALKYPEIVKRLLIVAHSLQNAQKTFSTYSSAMLELDFSKITTRKQADEALQAAVPDIGVRQFLLTNLVVGGDKLAWKCNLQGIHNNMDKFMDFPDHLDKSYKQPTLFVGGKNSNYISEKHMPAIHKFFPTSKIIHLEGAGHWVHAEKPEEFLKVATEFLNANK